MELSLPVVHRMGVPQDVLLKERRMHTNEGLGVKGSSHVININLSRLVQTRKVALPEGIQEPCEFVFRVFSQEIFVGSGGVALDQVSGNEPFVEKRRRERDGEVFPFNRKPLLLVVNDSFL